MGCDGGTIPTRDELVKTKKKPAQKDKDAERVFKWQHCHLTQEPLQPPIVACQMGRLYNKEAVILRLLDKAADGNCLESHIKSLKDIKELKLTANPDLEEKRTDMDQLASKWICPITGLEMNGRFKFVMEWSTGRVVSLRGLNMINKEGKEGFRPEDTVTLNPEEGEESNTMAERMRIRSKQAKAERREKRKKKADEGHNDETVFKKPKDELNLKQSDAKELKKEEKEKGKKKDPGSIQSDGSKSEVYKSIFSSHPSAQNRPKGHWVTFDPRYN